MNIEQSLPALAIVAGSTASGKSAWALDLAERCDGTIINMDALQVYRDLRVLTARPSPDDEARVPHRGFGVVDGAAPFDVASWVETAKLSIRETMDEGRLPILVGGTGLYLNTLLHGIAPVPPIEAGVREAVRSADPDANRDALEHEDPEMAACLRPSDRQRIARALEVVRSTGRSLADWQRGRSGGISGEYRLEPVIFDSPTDALAAGMEQRLERMMEEGAREEVEALLARSDLPSDAPIWRAIGARELAGWITGASGRADALAAALAATRAYAKRQRTWFRHQVPDDWPRMTALGTQIAPIGAATSSLKRSGHAGLYGR